jgi:hypothetical protein
VSGSASFSPWPLSRAREYTRLRREPQDQINYYRRKRRTGQCIKHLDLKHPLIGYRALVACQPVRMWSHTDQTPGATPGGYPGRAGLPADQADQERPGVRNHISAIGSRISWKLLMRAVVRPSGTARRRGPSVTARLSLCDGSFACDVSSSGTQATGEFRYLDDNADGGVLAVGPSFGVGERAELAGPVVPDRAPASRPSSRDSWTDPATMVTSMGRRAQPRPHA